MMTITSMTMITLLPLLLLSLTSLLNNTPTSTETSTPFECGFVPPSKARLPFSSRFFLLAILFLVFDIEIVLILPFIIFNWMPMQYTIYSFTLFLLILILGLIHEWNEGSLNWSE